MNRYVIVITGATGFVGQSVVKLLEKTEKSFIGLARPMVVCHSDSTPKHVIRGDLDTWLRTISEEKPESLLLCDWNGVEGKFRNDDTQFENVARWKVIAEVALSSGVKKIVALGSQAEIGIAQDNVDESAAFEPRSKYGMAKVKALTALNSITSSSECQVVWARLFSVYGQNMSDSWFISRLVKAISEVQALETSPLTQIWNLLHVEDCASAVIALSESGSSGIYNVASEKSIQLIELVEVVCTLLGKESKLKIGAIPFKSDETLIMRPRIEKLKSLGWSERILLEEGMRRFVEFKVKSKH